MTSQGWSSGEGNGRPVRAAVGPDEVVGLRGPGHVGGMAALGGG